MIIELIVKVFVETNPYLAIVPARASMAEAGGGPEAGGGTSNVTVILSTSMVETSKTDDVSRS